MDNMGLIEVLQQRIKPRKDESEEEAVYDTDAVGDASDSSATSSAENIDVEGETESNDDVRSFELWQFAQAYLAVVRN